MRRVRAHNTLGTKAITGGVAVNAEELVIGRTTELVGNRGRRASATC
jgi:hypothetical protein